MEKYLPVPDHPSIVVQTDLDAFYAYRRSARENVVLHPRRISGAFNELARHLWKTHSCYGILTPEGRLIETYYSREKLEAVTGLDDAQADALALIKADMKMMELRSGIRAELRVVPPRGYAAGTYHFHRDGAPYSSLLKGYERILCCYNVSTSEGLLEDDALPVKRADGHTDFIAQPGALPFRFGLGDIWRQACLGDHAAAFIHRAVQTAPNDPPRLLAVC